MIKSYGSLFMAQSECSQWIEMNGLWTKISISAIAKEVENWKGLPIEARSETKVSNLSYGLNHKTCDLFWFSLFKQMLRKQITDEFLQTGRPLAADNIVRQMNDPKIQEILGMYIAAMKNKSK